jgi:hypothetical protein
MAFITKEEFEKLVQADYDALDKKGFATLMNNTQEKLKELIASGDIVLEKTDDDYELKSVSKPYYEIALNTYQFVSKTKRLSLGQFKALSMFTGRKPTGSQTEFKQF